VPSDTQMREILDRVDPQLLRPLFNDVFRQLQRGKALEPMAYAELLQRMHNDAGKTLALNLKW